MKPTEKQKQFLKQVKLFVTYLENTNDVGSPTHEGNIDDLSSDLFDKINNKSYCEAFNDISHSLWYVVKAIK